MSPPVAAHDQRALAARILAVTGQRPRRLSPLAGGCVAEIYKVDLDDGGTLVAKLAPESSAPGGGLAIEGFMLDYLRRQTALPVPAVLHASETLLLLQFIETSGGMDESAERHGAELLAALHGITAKAYGFERDTVIGPLPQANPWTGSWHAFFRDSRLLAMGRRARESGNLTVATFDNLEKFCARIEDFIPEPAAPSLIHGDLWGGNILIRKGRIAACVDPAIYYADPEIELAFTTLFSTFGRTFFERYRELRPIAPGFFETRRDIYNLYPLLVHCALFGAPYGETVAGILDRHG